MLVHSSGDTDVGLERLEAVSKRTSRFRVRFNNNSRHARRVPLIKAVLARADMWRSEDGWCACADTECWNDDRPQKDEMGKRPHKDLQP
ncbi:hypothetical protein NDU88_006085 [Pleurodeles waltl]|uniref:Uncharacterized protein n=1 Tax=Pleurodeles waltl TaxID=8319 RepID=A0AAV7LZ65_PLEWA|nr:hypothetical protein NDU88_006085 [Pleurodeles waltl]